MAFVIEWDAQVTVIKEHDAIQTTIYETGEEVNNVVRLSIPLDAGITRLYILTYTSEVNQVFKCSLDVAAIGGTRLPILADLVDSDAYVIIPVGNQAIDLLESHFFKATPDQNATWTTTSAPTEGRVVLIHLDNTDGDTITFGTGFTDIAEVSETGIKSILLYYDGATWREIVTGGGGGILPAGTKYQMLVHDGASWTAEDFISLAETEDPPNTTEDVAIIWHANGAGSGQSGDVFIKIHQGGNPGVDRTYKLVDWDRGVNTSPIQYGQDFTWVFKMVDALDFASPETGKTPAVTISINGGAFAGLTGAPVVTEISNGWYKVTVDADDMVIGVVILKATAAGCAQEDMAIYM